MHIFWKKKVYKFINAVTSKNQNIIFDIGEDNSTASLEIKENSSIYNAELKKGQQVRNFVDVLKEN